MTSFVHVPVLVRETLSVMPDRVLRIVDSTVGGGGHSEAMLAAHPSAALLGIDRDPAALVAAAARFAPFAHRVTLVQGEFSRLHEHMAQLGWSHADFIFADFGVSSHQLDTPERGFSFRSDGPLDMRMSPQSAPLAERLQHVAERELADVIWRYGEERRSRRVAKLILAEQPKTTLGLANVVRRAVGPQKGIDPATRTFQALRIWVNDELGEVERWLDRVPSLLEPGGRLAAISFHSLEDRLVKHAIRRGENPCICPPQWPQCRCDAAPYLEALTRRPLCAVESEVRVNPRARSAKLRAAERVGAPQ